MKKRNKWKIWLSDAILKHRRTYAGIPGFFKKRIVNTLCLSFLLLYGGSALGLAQRSAGFVGWTVFLTICGIGDAVYVYYLAVTRSYEVVEGTVSEIHKEYGGMHMSLASIIISAATKEFAGFSVIGYLTEKAADVGTGKIWTELKKKISDKPDSFECRLYGAIEKSVGEYLCKETGEDVSAAICECIFDVWCLEGYLTPEQIANILYRYSAYAKQNDILEWYRTFQNQIIKDNVLYPMFMMNNIQLSGKLQREQDKKIDQVLALLQAVMKENKETQQKKPEYISDPPTDIDSFYVDRTMLENELWTAFILAGKSALLYGMGGIGKTEMAKAVLKKIYSLPCDVTGIYQIAWVTYTNGKLKDSLIEAFYDTKGYTDRDEACSRLCISG